MTIDRFVRALLHALPTTPTATPTLDADGGPAVGSTGSPLAASL